MVDLIDVVLEGFKDVVDWIIGLFMDGLTTGYNNLTEEMFGDPHPSDGWSIRLSGNRRTHPGQRFKMHLSVAR